MLMANSEGILKIFHDFSRSSVAAFKTYYLCVCNKEHLYSFWLNTKLLVSDCFSHMQWLVYRSLNCQSTKFKFCALAAKKFISIFVSEFPMNITFILLNLFENEVLGDLLSGIKHKKGFPFLWVIIISYWLLKT